MHSCDATALADSPWWVVCGIFIGFAVGFTAAVLQLPERNDADDEAAKRNRQRARFRRTEQARSWAGGTAVALALTYGLMLAQWHTWQSAVCRSKEVAWLGVGFCAVMGMALFAGALWFRHNRTSQRPDPRKDYPVTHFMLRQVVVVVPMALVVIQSVTGIAAVADLARRTASNAEGKNGLGSSQILKMVGLRRDYFALLSTAVLEVVVIVALIAIAQRALLSFFSSPRLRAYYGSRDPLFFGVMLSLVLAVVLVPSWGVLQEAGHRLAAVQLEYETFGLDWFAWRDNLDAALAPSIGPAAVLAALLGIVSPIATALISERVLHIGKQGDKK
jgi:hypothetical protein